ncbi:MAG: Flp pilus assembly complex ATPase component TadA, partial [Roseofilum sp. SID2]
MTQSPQKKPPSPPPRPPAPPPRAATSADGATQQMPARTMPMNPQAAKAAKAKAAPPPGAAPKAAKRSAAKAGPSPGNPTLQEIVKRADEDGVSDIHVGVNEIPRFRKRGDITSLEYPRTDLNTFMSWLRECMTDEEIRQFQDHLDFDGAFDFGFVRIRINVFDSLAGPAMVLRLIPSNILTMEQLKSPEVFKDICHYHKGLILVTGPTGSGKSTTMAAMIDYINRNMAHHIITIEDPVEFVHVSQKSLVKHREVGRHTREFKNALKAALRE